MGSESGDSGAGGKRKQMDEEKDVRTKKKKKKSNQMEVEGKRMRLCAADHISGYFEISRYFLYA